MPEAGEVITGDENGGQHRWDPDRGALPPEFKADEDFSSWDWRALQSAIIGYADPPDLDRLYEFTVGHDPETLFRASSELAVFRAQITEVRNGLVTALNAFTGDAGGWTGPAAQAFTGRVALVVERLELLNERIAGTPEAVMEAGDFYQRVINYFWLVNDEINRWATAQGLGLENGKVPVSQVNGLPEAIADALRPAVKQLNEYYTYAAENAIPSVELQIPADGAGASVTVPTTTPGTTPPAFDVNAVLAPILAALDDLMRAPGRGGGTVPDGSGAGGSGAGGSGAGGSGAGATVPDLPAFGGGGADSGGGGSTGGGGTNGSGAGLRVPDLPAFGGGGVDSGSGGSTGSGGTNGSGGKNGSGGTNGGGTRVEMPDLPAFGGGALPGTGGRPVGGLPNIPSFGGSTSQRPGTTGPGATDLGGADGPGPQEPGDFTPSPELQAALDNAGVDVDGPDGTSAPGPSVEDLQRSTLTPELRATLNGAGVAVGTAGGQPSLPGSSSPSSDPGGADGGGPAGGVPSMPDLPAFEPSLQRPDLLGGGGGPGGGTEAAIPDLAGGGRTASGGGAAGPTGPAGGLPVLEPFDPSRDYSEAPTGGDAIFGGSPGGTGGAPAAGAAAANGAGAGASMPPMMPPPMGGMGAGSGNEEKRETWLREDREVWAVSATFSPGVLGTEVGPDPDGEVEADETAARHGSQQTGQGSRSTRR